MKKIELFFIILIIHSSNSYSQNKFQIDSLLNIISKIKNSKEISTTKEAKEIIAFKEKTLLLLTEFFKDSTLTNVESECHNRKLNKGEIAIILADNIEIMPYASLTNVQICFPIFCENNPNRIEYFFPWINQNGVDNFETKYISWLYDKERLNWPVKLKGKERKRRKKIIENWNKTNHN